MTIRLLTAVFSFLAALSVLAALWYPQSDPNGRIPLVWVSDNNPARTLQIEAFNEQNPGFVLGLDYNNGGTEKVILQSSSGVGPDIFDFGDENIGTYVESGILWDVTEAAVQKGFADIWPTGRGTVTYGGRQYGFPCNIGAPILIYNKKVFDELRLPYPGSAMTWEEFTELAAKIRPTSGGKVFAISGATWRLFFESLRGEFFHEDGRPHIAQSAELRKAFEMHRDFLFVHGFMPTALEAQAMSGQGGWGSGNLNQFANGKFAMIVTGHWALISFGRAYQQQVENLKKGGEHAKPPLRLGAVVGPHFAGYPPTYRIQSRVAGINAMSPRREEALAFLQYLAGPTYSRLLNEGTDWLPGNPAYAELGITPGPEDLARTELQDATRDAVTHGYVPRHSPFLLTSDVVRVLSAQISRMESSPTIPIESLLATAEMELKVLMRRNLDRNPKLKSLYVQRFGEGGLAALR